MHGAEEHPSPSGFAMVFQKAPLNIKSLRSSNNVKSSSSSVWSIGLSPGNSKNKTVSSVQNVFDANRAASTTPVARSSDMPAVASSTSLSMVIF